MGNLAKRTVHAELITMNEFNKLSFFNKDNDDEAWVYYMLWLTFTLGNETTET